jgi:hypothetical protein
MPEVPQDDGEDSADDVSENAGESSSPDEGSDSESVDDDSEGTSSSGDEEESVENDVQTLGGAEEKSEQKNKQSGKGGSPTPAAPEAGNASNDEEPFLGMTEMAVIGALVMTGMGLAFVAGSRRRKEDPRELPFE